MLNRLFIVLIFSLPIVVFGQKIEILCNTDKQFISKFEFDENDFKYSKINNVSYLNFNENTPLTLTEYGAPILPFFAKSILIPNTGSSLLKISYENFVEFNDLEILPNKQRKKRDTVNNSELFFSDIYNRNEFYPGDIVKLETPYRIRELRGQVIKFYPYQYNPVTKTLRFYKNIKVEIDFTNSTGLNEVYIKESTSNFGHAIYASQHINHSTKIEKYLMKQDEGEMLIISPISHIENVKPLLNWKNQKGIKTTLVTTSTTGKSSDSIKKFIKQYNDSNPNLLHVLLIGDNNDIPPFYYGNVNSPDGIYDVWSDSYYGQLTDDYYPELFIGRFSGTPEQVKNSVNRTLAYEKSNDSDNWVTNAINIGSSEGSLFGDNNEADWQHLRNIKYKLDSIGFSKIYEFYDGTRGGNDDPGNPSSSMISSALNNGVGILNYTGHGDDNILYTSSFTSNDIMNLSNFNNLPFVISVACNNGRFINRTCLAETFMTAQIDNKDIGAIAVCASSILMDWAPPMKTQDEIINLIDDRNLTTHKSTLGGLFWNGQFSMLEKYGNNGIEVMKTWIFFGDPSIVYRYKPNEKITADIKYNIVDSTINITSNVEQAIVGISNENKYITSGHITNNNFNCKISSTEMNDSLLITITKQNYSPIQYYLKTNNKVNTYLLPETPTSVFPNPFDKYITIIGNRPDEIILYDILGNKISTTINFIQENKIEINTENLKSGYYILQIKVNQNIHNIKITKDINN